MAICMRLPSCRDQYWWYNMIGDCHVRTRRVERRSYVIQTFAAASRISSGFTWILIINGTG